MRIPGTVPGSQRDPAAEYRRGLNEHRINPSIFIKIKINMQCLILFLILVFCSQQPKPRGSFVYNKKYNANSNEP